MRYIDEDAESWITLMMGIDAAKNNPDVRKELEAKLAPEVLRAADECSSYENFKLLLARYQADAAIVHHLDHDFWSAPHPVITGYELYDTVRYISDIWEKRISGSITGNAPEEVMRVILSFMRAHHILTISDYLEATGADCGGMQPPSSPPKPGKRRHRPSREEAQLLAEECMLYTIFDDAVMD